MLLKCTWNDMECIDALEHTQEKALPNMQTFFETAVK